MAHKLFNDSNTLDTEFVTCDDCGEIIEDHVYPKKGKELCSECVERCAFCGCPFDDLHDHDTCNVHDHSQESCNDEELI